MADEPVITHLRGTYTLSNGETVEFHVTPQGSAQWGAPTSTLGLTVDATSAIAGLDLVVDPEPGEEED